MQLNFIERFALSKIFPGNDLLSACVRDQLDSAWVTEREYTGVGFFSTIRFPCLLPEAKYKLIQWDWNFTHNKLRYGGSFMCWREDGDGLAIEAVAHGGVDWPPFDEKDEDGFAEEGV
jgi:hypothetical protein